MTRESFASERRPLVRWKSLIFGNEGLQNIIRAQKRWAKVRAAPKRRQTGWKGFDQMKTIRLEATPNVIGRLRNANETDRESRNAVVGPLAHLNRADSVPKSERFWARSSSSRPGHRRGCLDPAGSITVG